MSLRKKLLILVVLPVVICTTIAILLSSFKIYNQGINDLTNKSNAILTINIFEFIHTHAEYGSIIGLNREETLKGVTSKIDSASQNYRFHIASSNPIDERNAAKESDLKFIERFKNENIDGLTHIDHEQNYLKVMRPVYMDESRGCLECHELSNNQSVHNNLRGIFVVESDMSDLKTNVKASIFQNSIIGFIIVVIAVILGIIIVNKISNAVDQIIKVSKKVSEGNLNERVNIKTNDELENVGNNINEMVESLNRVLSGVHEAAGELNSATGDIAKTSSTISHGAQFQSQQFGTLTDSVNDTTENLNYASEFIKKTESNAGIAESGMNNTINSISAIAESSQKIYKEVQTINNIAFQTKILALNAAIEAARAGVHGKGFAVVAAEVQKLSEISETSSKEINDLTSESLIQVKDGVKIAQDAGQKIKEIIEMVSQISSSLSQISDVATEQNSIVNKNHEITNSNASAAEELEAATNSLKDQANALLEIVGYFELKE